MTFEDLKFRAGTISFAKGQHEVVFDLPFPVEWVWLKVEPHHQYYCGGEVHNEVGWAAEGEHLTIIADILTEHAAIIWAAVGD